MIENVIINFGLLLYKIDILLDIRSKKVKLKISYNLKIKRFIH
jgi:hypothetical protein